MVHENIKETNIVVMTLNMLCMYLKDVFVLVPSQILSDTLNPLFFKAIEEFLFSYKNAIEEEGNHFEGRPQDKIISPDFETSYHRIFKK